MYIHCIYHPLEHACLSIFSVQYTSVNSSDDAHPHIDYTPPHYITLLFSDIGGGVLTPSAVSDELIKLYL